MKLSPTSDADMIDVMGSGDAREEQEDDKAIEKQEAQKAAPGREEAKEKPTEVLDESNDVPDSWDTSAPSNTAAVGRDQSPSTSENVEKENGLPKVLKAFELLQEEFNEKFKKMWA